LVDKFYKLNNFSVFCVNNSENTVIFFGDMKTNFMFASETKMIQPLLFWFRLPPITSELLVSFTSNYLWTDWDLPTE